MNTTKVVMWVLVNTAILAGYRGSTRSLVGTEPTQRCIRGVPVDSTSIQTMDTTIEQPLMAQNKLYLFKKFMDNTINVTI